MLMSRTVGTRSIQIPKDASMAIIKINRVNKEVMEYPTFNNMDVRPVEDWMH